MRTLVEILFILFFIYTLVYFFQLFFGLCVSIYRFSKSPKKKLYVKRLFPNHILHATPVSVIVPAYNEAACICNTIDSLLNEDYPNLEILIVNDGSADHTEELLVNHYKMERKEFSYTSELATKPVRRYYSKQFADKTLRFICKDNGGKSDALNCGLNFCSNALCIIIDADTRIQKGSLRVMASHFIMDSHVIVCAGSVNGNNNDFQDLSISHKSLVLFQKLEYYRTFYLQRIVFDHLNANIVVSGAFAMFRSDLLKKIGGYKVDTIGEDMELTMRLHAFCASQKFDYRITYAPEAKCITQFPFTYKDFYRQRLRWHIGMIQSMNSHRYMLGKLFYGWAGIISGTYVFFYEFFAPFIEIIGLLTLLAANLLNILDLKFTLSAMLTYSIFIILIQTVHAKAIDIYQIDQVNFSQHLLLLLISIVEIIFFHPFNTVIKLIAFFKRKRHQKRWDHIKRI